MVDNLFYINPLNLPELDKRTVEYMGHTYVMRKYGYVIELKPLFNTISGKTLRSLMKFFNVFNFKLLNIDIEDGLCLNFVCLGCE